MVSCPAKSNVMIWLWSWSGVNPSPVSSSRASTSNLTRSTESLSRARRSSTILATSSPTFFLPSWKCAFWGETMARRAAAI